MNYGILTSPMADMTQAQDAFCVTLRNASGLWCCVQCVVCTLRLNHSGYTRLITRQWEKAKEYLSEMSAYRLCSASDSIVSVLSPPCYIIERCAFSSFPAGKEAGTIFSSFDHSRRCEACVKRLRKTLRGDVRTSVEREVLFLTTHVLEHWPDVLQKMYQKERSLVMRNVVKATSNAFSFLLHFKLLSIAFVNFSSYL